MKKKIIYGLMLGGLFFALTISIKNVSAASDMAKAQKGKILLQVEANGEAWYVNPSDELRYYMGRPDDAFSLMRKLGVGVTTANLKKIKIAPDNMAGDDSDGDGLSNMFEDAIGTDKNKADTDGDSYNDYQEFTGGYNPLGSGKMSNGDATFSNSQKGKIFIQVEQNGEAWYINPSDGMRYFMGRPADAFGLMRKLGMGITNSNLDKISISNGSNNSSNNNPTTQVDNNNNNNIDDTIDSVLDPELSAIIESNQEKIREFISVYDVYSKSKYEALASELFVSSSQAKVKNLTSDFFIEFAEYTLKRLDKMDLNEEYIFAAGDDESLLPYEKVNDSTIVVGLGVEFIMPYELKKENGNWKIDLNMTKAYYDEIAKIDTKEENAENSEVEIYLMGKIKTALNSYKSANGKYPKYLNQATKYYTALKNYSDDFYYAVQSDLQQCHFGIDVMDDDKVLNKDSDFNSLDANYDEGFEGEDPVYDIHLK